MPQAELLKSLMRYFCGPDLAEHYLASAREIGLGGRVAAESAWVWDT